MLINAKKWEMPKQLLLKMRTQIWNQSSMVITYSKGVHMPNLMKVLPVNCLWLIGIKQSRTHSRKEDQETPTWEISANAHQLPVLRLLLMKLIYKKNTTLLLKEMEEDLKMDSLEVSKQVQISSTSPKSWNSNIKLLLSLQLAALTISTAWRRSSHHVWVLSFRSMLRSSWRPLKVIERSRIAS